MDAEEQFQPLAARLRPTTLDEYFGQQHLLGPNKPLRKSILAGHHHSMILWGPPGTGKTTLAELIAQYANARILRLSAVTSGVKDIRAAIEQAKENKQQRAQKTLLFVDEVHRFNKSQQDAFLPFIEDGTIIFIGATTENPSFELNNAIISRARVYLLKKLDEVDLNVVLERALTDPKKGLGEMNIQMEASVRQLLCQIADGDARRLLNLLEIANDFADEVDGMTHITIETIEAVSGSSIATMDKQGDHYFDLISAFHKSVRGSSPDGALYWYCRILAGGGDPLYVARRLLAIATEDIGNADPRAMQVALNAWDIFHRVGPAEGERAIAQATLYLASAPKSNAVYMAFNQAKSDASLQPSYEVPHHLRNAPTQLMKGLGYGDSYRYAHDEPGAFAPGENYFPEEIKDTRYYYPSDRGLEKQIQDKLKYLKQQDQQSPQKRYERA
ncbi:replication-associated recombination protein A [Algicola sagamiensis]|uniref:replication-associated recombination protein A n=1 Tax=Algicola sagamiensis TaxID=163869 RepID=UPI0004756192|nr:replication-associated recombination protein A [Algicola sagamiensis]